MYRKFKTQIIQNTENTQYRKYKIQCNNVQKIPARGLEGRTVEGPMSEEGIPATALSICCCSSPPFIKCVLFSFFF